jgi:hypothetical protein
MARLALRDAFIDLCNPFNLKDDLVAGNEVGPFIHTPVWLWESLKPSTTVNKGDGRQPGLIGSLIA